MAGSGLFPERMFLILWSQDQSPKSDVLCKPMCLTLPSTIQPKAAFRGLDTVPRDLQVRKLGWRAAVPRARDLEESGALLTEYNLSSSHPRWT